MKYYVKVTKQVAEKIIRSGVPLTMTSDGNCLLYQSELNGVDGVNNVCVGGCFEEGIYALGREVFFAQGELHLGVDVAKAFGKHTHLAAP